MHLIFSLRKHFWAEIVDATVTNTHRSTVTSPTGLHQPPSLVPPVLTGPTGLHRSSSPANISVSLRYWKYRHCWYWFLLIYIFIIIPIDRAVTSYLLHSNAKFSNSLFALKSELQQQNSDFHKLWWKLFEVGESIGPCGSLVAPRKNEIFRKFRNFAELSQFSDLESLWWNLVKN